MPGHERGAALLRDRAELVEDPLHEALLARRVQVVRAGLGRGAQDRLAVDREGAGARDHGRAWLERLRSALASSSETASTSGEPPTSRGKRVELLAAAPGEHEIGAGGRKLGGDEAPGVARGAVDRDSPHGALRLRLPAHRARTYPDGAATFAPWPPPSPQQVRMRERFEALIGLAAPVLDLVLAAGDRLSRVAGPEDEYYPIRPPGEAFELSPVPRSEDSGEPPDPPVLEPEAEAAGSDPLA